MIHSKLLALKPDHTMLKLDFEREFSRSFRVEEVFWDEKEVVESKEADYEMIESSSEEEKHHHKHKHHHHHQKEKKEKKKSVKKRKRTKESNEMFASELASDHSERGGKLRKLDATFMGWKYVFVGNDPQFSFLKDMAPKNTNNSGNANNDDGPLISPTDLPLFLSTLFIEQCYRSFETNLKSHLEPKK
jgi:hypothetical protein